MKNVFSRIFKVSILRENEMEKIFLFILRRCAMSQDKVEADFPKASISSDIFKT